MLDEKSISIFKKNWRSVFPNDGKIFDAVSKGKFTEGIESYFPLFYESKPNFDIFFNDFDSILDLKMKNMRIIHHFSKPKRNSETNGKQNAKNKKNLPYQINGKRDTNRRASEHVQGCHGEAAVAWKNVGRL